MKQVLIFIAVSIAICCGVFDAKSQTPGYLGNRATISADLNIAPDLISFLERGTTPLEAKFYFLRLNVESSYAISRKVAIGLHFGHFKRVHQGQVLTAERFDSTEVPLSQSPAAYSDYLAPLSEWKKTEIFNIGGSYQHFLQSCIAPAGDFIEIKASAVISSTRFYSPDLRSILVRPESTFKVSTSLKLSLGYVRNYILADWVLIRYGLEGGVDFGGMRASEDLLSEKVSAYSNENYLINQSRILSLHSSYASLKVGIGFIPPTKFR